VRLIGGRSKAKTEGLCMSIAFQLLLGNTALCYAATEANAERIKARVAEIVGEQMTCGLTVKVTP